jgi:hypothetical protein
MDQSRTSARAGDPLRGVSSPFGRRWRAVVA